MHYNAEVYLYLRANNSLNFILNPFLRSKTSVISDKIIEERLNITVSSVYMILNVIRSMLL